MSDWDNLRKELDVYKTEFNRLYKCLNTKTKISKETRNINLKNLIFEYNNIIAVYIDLEAELTVVSGPLFEKYIFGLRDRLVTLFDKSKVNIYLPISPTELIKPELKNPDFEDFSNSEDEEIIKNKMPQSATDLLRIAAQTINRNYFGDPLGLNAFINAIELLESVTEEENKDVLKRFILAKLEGKALEAIPPNPATVLIIKEALKSKIKPDSSKIIEGRMLALKNDKISTQEFSKAAEELADAFTRTLIVEGIPQDKANEMSIEKTVDMCRATTRSNLVKSVLASSQFTDAKSVIAKFIVESNTENRDKQVLSYKSFHGNDRFKNYNRNSSTYPHRNSFNHNYNYHEKRYNNNQKFTNSKFNSQQNRAQNSNNRFNRNRGNRFQYNSQNANIRYTDSGNSSTLQQRGLGEINSETN